MSSHSEQSIDSPPLEAEQKKLPSGEEIWNEMSADVRIGIEKLYQKYRYDPKDTGEEERREALEVRTARERQFVLRVWDELAKFYADNPYSINLLFDIDDTLACFKRDETGNDGDTIFRPAAVYLLNRLRQTYGARLKIGFITTRDGERLEQQLDDPRHLGPIQQFIDRAALFSTQNLAENLDLGNPEDLAFYKAIHDGAQEAEGAEYCREIIDPKKLAETEEDQFRKLFQYSGDQQKTALLARLVREHPDQAYIAIDDFHYPSILKKNDPHIRGVWLDQEAAFYL